MYGVDVRMQACACVSVYDFMIYVCIPVYMYVYICVCMYDCMMYACPYLHTCTSHLLHAYIHTHIHKYLHICIRALRLYQASFTYIHACIPAHFTYIHACIPAHIYV